MDQRLLVGFLLGLGFFVGQSTGHPQTESLPVKEMPVNGVSLAYVEEGTGETVVFVHGAMGDWRSWDALRPFIAGKYHYVSYSRRYHYPNAWPDDGRNYSWRQHAEDLAAFIRALRAGPVHLVGNSYGGVLVAMIAIEHPQLLRSVVIGEPAMASLIRNSPEGRQILADHRKQEAPVREAVKAGDWEKAAIFLYDHTEGEAGAFRKIPEAQQEIWLANAKTIGPMLSGKPYPLSCEKIGTIRVPTLVVRGECTPPYHLAETEGFRSCLPPGSACAVIPNVSHLWSANPKAASEAILRFIDKHQVHAFGE
jgi:pimeloyl-ACP methyl ester carboxylesterase